MTLRASIQISGQGVSLLGRQFDGTTRKLQRMGATGGRVGRMMSRSFKGASTAVSRLAGGIAAIGVAASARKVLGFNESLSQLQVDADMSVKSITDLKTQMLGVSKATGMLPGQLMAGMRVFQDFGGQLKFGRDMMKDLAKFAYATNTPMAQAAKLAATLKKNLGLKTKSEVLDAMVTLNELGKAGNLSLAEMAGDLPKAFGSGKGSGYTGSRGVQQIGAMMQIIGGQKGSSSEAQTAITRLLNDLTRQAGRIKKKTGFNVYDDKGDLKNFEVIAKTLLAKTKGLKSKMLNVLGLSGYSAGALGAFADTTNKAVLSASAKKMFSAGKGKSASDISRMFKAKSESGPGKSAFAAKKGIASLSAGLQEYGGRAVGFAAEKPGTAAGLAVGGYAALKMLPAIGRFLLGRGKAGGLGGAAAGLGGVQQVFVVNMAGASSPFTPGAAGGAAGGAAKGGLGMLLKTAGFVAAAGVVANQVGFETEMIKLQAASDLRVKSHGGQVKGASLASTALQFQQLAKGGVGSVQTKDGGRVALTQESAMALLKAQSDREGGGDAVFNAMKPLLESMLAELKKGPKVEIVAPGIDRPDVKQTRGQAQ